MVFNLATCSLTGDRREYRLYSLPHARASCHARGGPNSSTPLPGVRISTGPRLMRQISRSLLRLGAQSHGCKTAYACRVRLDDHKIQRPTDCLPCTPPCMSADYGPLSPNES